MTKRNLILSGGFGHDFADTSATIAELLVALDVESEIVEPPNWNHHMRRLDGVDLLTINALRWSMSAPRYEHDREEYAYATSLPFKMGIEAHLAAGRGILCMHTACICFDDWPLWSEILGAAWDWNRSFHPEYGDRVEVHDTLRRERFPIADEVYHALRTRSGRDVIGTAAVPRGTPPQHAPLVGDARTGGAQAVLWRRHHGQGRVVVDTLGHDSESLRNPKHFHMLSGAVEWALSHQIMA